MGTHEKNQPHLHYQPISGGLYPLIFFVNFNISKLNGLPLRAYTAITPHCTQSPPNVADYTFDLLHLFLKKILTLCRVPDNLSFIFSKKNNGFRGLSIFTFHNNTTSKTALNKQMETSQKNNSFFCTKNNNSGDAMMKIEKMISRYLFKKI